MKKSKRLVYNTLMFFALPITYISAVWLKYIRKAGQHNLTDNIFMKLGVLPVLDHYYQPLINPHKYLKKPLNGERYLPAINMCVEEQLTFLAELNYGNELILFPLEKRSQNEFYYNNGSYCSGDAEYLYSVIRKTKPSKIIEIGSGQSTLMVQNALIKNSDDNSSYRCDHTCIEPYEQPWLETINVNLIRKKVEEIDLSLFSSLGRNDILFIDSSHIIRAQGDVLCEYLEILPSLKEGVLIHIHDIFTPRDYPESWINEHLLWNEQYLLEAFLSFNTEYKVIGALNYLSNNFKKEFSAVCPIYALQPGRQPGALWLVKTSNHKTTRSPD